MHPRSIIKLHGVKLGDNEEIVLCPDNVSTFAHNLTVQGTLTANNFVAGDSSLFIPIQTPIVDTSVTRPIYISGTTYTTTTGLDLTPAVLGTNAFQLIDQYIDTYMYDTPPAPLGITASSTTSTSITIDWQTLPSFQAAFLGERLPHVTEIRIDIQAAGSNWSSFTTRATGSRDVNELILHATGSGTVLVGNVYHWYTISSGTAYDVRVYGVNFATGSRATKYAYALNVQTGSVGVPSAPTAPITGTGTSTTTISLTYQPPVDNDNVTVGNNSQPVISQYSVVSTPTSTMRFGGLFDSSVQTRTTPTVSSGVIAATTVSVTGLLPGTGYAMVVSARNELNATYGPTATMSPSPVLTSYPTAPANLAVSDSSALSNLSTIVQPYGVTGGYNLAGTTIISPIVNLAQVGTTGLALTTSPLVLLNASQPGTTLTSAGSVYGYSGADTAAMTLSGFPLVVGTSSVSSGSVTIDRIGNEIDPYTSSSAGFWKTGSFRVRANTPSTLFTPSVSSYNLKLGISGTGYNVQTTPVVFYTETISSVPVLDHLCLTAGSTGGWQYVSGIPGWTSAANFTVQFNMSNIANKFLRNDRLHAEYWLQGSGGSGSVLGSTRTLAFSNIGTTGRYMTSSGSYTTNTSTPLGVSGLILPESPGDVQFNSFSSVLDLSTNAFDENLVVVGYGLNLFGAGLSVTGNMILGGTGSAQLLRTDTKSTVVLNAIAASGITQVLSGTSGPYPGVTGMTVYDHALSISGTRELQLVSGRFHSVGATIGYRDYTGFYGGPGSASRNYTTSVIAPADVPTDVRYVTFRMSGADIGVTSGSTFEKIRVQLIDAYGLTINLTTPNLENHQMFIRVVDTGDGSSDSDTSTVGWMNACNVVLPIGIQHGDNNTFCLNHDTSSNTQRDIILRNGTTQSALVYIRIGIPNNVNAGVARITVQPILTFT